MCPEGGVETNTPVLDNGRGMLLHRDMAWIRTIAPREATGLLKQLYASAVQRAGKVFNIIRLQSPRPHVLRASTRLYVEVMISTESGLSRAQREMIATAVSRANACHY